MCEKNKFSELEGYMWVDHNGNYHFEDDCPEDLKEKVRKEWPEYKKEVLEKKKQFIVDSRDWF